MRNIQLLKLDYLEKSILAFRPKLKFHASIVVGEIVKMLTTDLKTIKCNFMLREECRTCGCKFSCE
jgi:hypothetical protein